MNTLSPQVELRELTLDYDGATVVERLDLHIARGSFLTLVGPSGCGKTTLLRAIAGLVTPRQGEIVIKGRRMNEVPIHRRNIGLVFQSYALFPHRNVFDNVAFGLRQRGLDRAAIAQRVQRALHLVQLPGLDRRMPAQLSGGQQQRIALARAIVIEPDVLLLDEPLSALDANLRASMRMELKAIQRDLGITTVFVTHDQEEALAMSDQVAVMQRGAIQQCATPEEIYRRPASRFVADFFGRNNVLAVEVAGGGDGLQLQLPGGLQLRLPAAAALAAGRKLDLVIRADRLHLDGPDRPARENSFRGRILSVAFLGGSAACVIEVAGCRLQAVAALTGPIPREGETVRVAIAAEDCALFDPVSGQRLPAPEAAAQGASLDIARRRS